MLINFTNHPACGWSRWQLEARECIGGIADVPFPDVPADLDEDGIAMIADEYREKILSLDPEAVLVQGEMSLAFAVVQRLLNSGVRVLCAASERTCETFIAEDGSTVKRSVFKFVRFREYRFL